MYNLRRSYGLCESLIMVWVSNLT